MSHQVLPPNPSLVAIILIIKTRRGVKRVFHYPPNPGRDRPHAKLDYDDPAVSESSASSSSSGYSSLEDEASDPGAHRSGSGSPDEDESSSVSPQKDGEGGFLGGRERLRQHHRAGSESGSGGKVSSNFLGLPDGFDQMLCPPAQQHKKRFELTIGQLVFLGWPVYAQDGEWRRRRKRRPQRDAGHYHHQQPRRMSTISEVELAKGMLGRRTSVQMDELLAETSGVGESAEESEGGGGGGAAGPEAAGDEAQNLMSSSKELETVPEAGEDNYAEDAEEKKSPELAMFHVVFVMNPPPNEYHLRVDEMYKHIVKKFSRALKWEQSRSAYVQKECEKLKALKAKHESLARHAIDNSSLAKAIATVYDYISSSRIAHVDLTSHLSFSLQIPIPTSISQLPDLTSPRFPGLWLTTATAIPSNDELHHTRSKLASHFALLLLSDQSSILADVRANPSPLSTALEQYLEVTKPTKSFLQISQSSGIPLADIHLLASHLVFWRRARAVPPLHQRDTYIVSPNADMRKLKSAQHAYDKLFPPQYPTLPKMLALLSQGVPRPYRMLVPSKLHKPKYMDILAWLMRGGWVTQLRSFAYVRVPAAVQAAVAREEERAAATAVEEEQEEEVELRSRRRRNRRAPRRSGSGSADDDDDDEDDEDDDDEEEEEEAGEPDRSSPPAPRALSPGRASGLNSPASVSSARTAIPLGMISSTGSIIAQQHHNQQHHHQPPPLLPLPPHHHPPPPPPKLNLPADNDDDKTNEKSASGLPEVNRDGDQERFFSPQLILHPTKASGLESRWLAAIARELEAAEGAEVREGWEKCVKYFNGEHALEKIAVREGVKRKTVEGWRATWVRLGVVLEVRGW